MYNCNYQEAMYEYVLRFHKLVEKINEIEI